MKRSLSILLATSMASNTLPISMAYAIDTSNVQMVSASIEQNNSVSNITKLTGETKLTSNTTANYVVESGVTATLDLNGYTLNGTTGSVITVYGTLNLIDSSVDKNGKITGGVAQSGGGIYISNSGELNMSGGTITGNEANGGNGGGIYVDDGGTFNLTGGLITENKVTLNDDFNGGAGVYVYKGNFTMSDGEITKNTAEGTLSSGGGIYINNSTFTMTGGKITENSATKYGDGVVMIDSTFNISGSPIINNNQTSNVHLFTNEIITITGELTEQANIGVTLADITNTVATGSNGETGYKSFISDLSGYSAEWSNSNNKVGFVVNSDNIAVTDVSIKESTSLTVGGNEILTATITPDNATNKNVTWSSSDNSVATVNENGVVTGVSVGTAIITVITEDGNYTKTCAVTVSAGNIAVTDVSIKESTSFTVGKTETLTATITPDNATNKNVTWSSSDNSVATVNENGVVTGVSVGTAIITVITEDGNYTKTCAVTVSAVSVEVTGVSIKESTSLIVGGSETLTATITPDNATNKNVTWSSSNDSVATVSENGVVTGVSVGTATITVKTADGNKEATCEVTVSAVPKQEQTGFEINSSSTIEFGETLTITTTGGQSSGNVTYTVSNDTGSATIDSTTGELTPVSVGDVIVTATKAGDDDYNSIQATQTITITEVDITLALISGVEDKTYTGNEITQSIQVELDGLTLVEGIDYDISYSNNTNVGQATITVTAKGNYTGTVSKNFNITKATLTSDMVSGITSSYEYTGSTYDNLEPTIIFGGNILVKDTDYTLSYGTTNTDVGTGTIIVTGTGNFNSTSFDITFEIIALSINTAVITGVENEYATDGSTAQTPEPTITLGRTELIKDTDYTISYSNNTDFGVATITITGINNYTGEITKNFSIYDDSKESISSAIVEWSDWNGSSDFEYNGSEIKPIVESVTLTLSDGTSTILTEGTDYEISYSNNTDVGIGSVVISAKSDSVNYTSALITEFNITPKDIDSASISGVENSYTWTGTAIEINDLEVSDDSTDLVINVDYNVLYENNTNTGIANIIITGIGNYKGTQNIEFLIVAPVLPPTITIDNGNYEDGSNYDIDIYTTSLENWTAPTATAEIGGITENIEPVYSGVNVNNIASARTQLATVGNTVTVTYTATDNEQTTTSIINFTSTSSGVQTPATTTVSTTYAGMNYTMEVPYRVTESGGIEFIFNDVTINTLFDHTSLMNGNILYVPSSPVMNDKRFIDNVLPDLINDLISFANSLINVSTRNSSIPTEESIKTQMKSEDVDIDISCVLTNDTLEVPSGVQGVETENTQVEIIDANNVISTNFTVEAPAVESIEVSSSVTSTTVTTEATSIEIKGDKVINVTAGGENLTELKLPENTKTAEVTNVANGQAFKLVATGSALESAIFDENNAVVDSILVSFEPTNPSDNEEILEFELKLNGESSNIEIESDKDLEVSIVIPITIKSVTGGTIKVNGSSSSKSTVNTGDKVTLTATTNSGYTFSNWVVTYKDIYDKTKTITVKNNSFTVNLDMESITVSAEFTKNSTSSSGSNSSSGGSSSGSTSSSLTITTVESSTEGTTQTTEVTTQANITNTTNTELSTPTTKPNPTLGMTNEQKTEYYIPVLEKFVDLKASNWAFNSIGFVVDRNYFNGINNEEFKPEDNMSRAMIVTVLSRIAEIDTTDISLLIDSNFSDVPAGSWYEGAVNWAVTNNITSGKGNGFDPDGNVTRQEMAVFFSRFADNLGIKLPKVNAAVEFADNNSIDSWAIEQVSQLQQAGIINGKLNNLFDPNGTATRAEVATMVERFVELIDSTQE